MRPLILPVVLGVVAGCTQRTEVSDSKYVSRSYVELDSNRVLAALVHVKEYQVTGFMLDKEEKVYDCRYVVLDLAGTETPKPMKARNEDDLWKAELDGAEVLLDSWEYLDLATERVMPTGYRIEDVPHPGIERYSHAGQLESGPGNGTYLYPAVFESRYADADIRQWFHYDRAGKSYTSFLIDTSWAVRDVAYEHGKPWALYSVDSLTVSHRSLGPDSASRDIPLPDTLSEWNARVEYSLGSTGLWLEFHCGRCHPLPTYWYLKASDPAASWRASRDWKPDSILHSLKLDGDSLHSVKLSRFGDTTRSRVFDLTSLLK